VRAGDLFVAAAGASTHGARFAADALAAGPSRCSLIPPGQSSSPRACRSSWSRTRAVLGRLSAWFYDFPAAALKTIGVTGTQGKTSTTFLIDAALGERRSGLIGSMGSKIDGIPVPTKLTTPEAPALHALLAKMREAVAVLSEVSSQAITMRRVDGMVFDVAVFLNLGHDHLDFHGSQENYRAAKRELLTPAMSRLALVNIDDQAGRRFHDDPELHTESFSITGRDADWRAVDIDLGPTARLSRWSARRGSPRASRRRSSGRSR
jgi:UDP-N-acetylmuramoyl-L-alanyl-D-glutamate--2,6-diaminopimelate ligase